MSLSARQTESLIQKQALIRHVLDEAAVDGDMAVLNTDSTTSCSGTRIFR